jgi:hypothetical protein
MKLAFPSICNCSNESEFLDQHLAIGQGFFSVKFCAIHEHPSNTLSNV